MRLGRVLLVVNPICGRGRAAGAARELREEFARHGVAAELLTTSYRGHAAELLASAGRADLVVAVGGDGTLSEVFQALPEADVPVGLFPRGTANMLARFLRLPRDAPGAVEVFLSGRERWIDVARAGSPLGTGDVARAGERFSHLVVGIGFDAEVVSELERRRRGPITMWSYAGPLLRTLARYRPPELSVTIDGERVPGTFGLVLVANTPGYAGLLHLLPEARIDDGALEVYLFPSGRLPRLAAAFARALVAHLPGGAVQLRRGGSVRVEARVRTPWQVDGDLGGVTPVEVELCAERYRLVVP